jgi:serine/threonine protein phosphatase PrpC
MTIERKLELSYGQASEIGPKESNDDCIGIRIGKGESLVTKGSVCVIADGVSAAEFGKIASEACVQGFISDYFSTPDTWDVKKSTQTILTALNRWLCSQGRDSVDLQRGYVTTLAIVIFKSCQAHVFHAGDSRVYLCRDGELELLTKDHSVQVSQEVKYLSRAMGMDTSLKVDYRRLDTREGDYFLATTDGAHGHLGEREVLLAIAAHPGNLEKACVQMVRKALENGGDDNASCALLRIDNLPKANREDAVKKLHSLPFPPDLDEGMKFEGWDIRKLLHASPRSQLYLVSDLEDPGQKAVMKTPSVNFRDDIAYIERFIQEEWITSRVDNPNVIKPLRRKTKDPKFLYHVWEHVEGKSLADWMAENPLPAVEDILGIISQAIRGIRALHRKGIIHQDLKLDNILLHRGGTVKVIDLGSCYSNSLSEIYSPVQQDKRLGTLDYTAPEYSIPGKPTRLADQFSLAIIAYKLLTSGQHPYGTAYMEAHDTGQFGKLRYIPASTHNRMVPQWVDASLAKALSILPEDRYESFSEFLNDLEYPNPTLSFHNPDAPLLKRDPGKFWKGLAAILAVTQAVTLYFLLK